MKFLSLITLLIFSLSINIQAQDDSSDHFLVEFEKFTPPVKDLVRYFEGKPAEKFLASDTEGTEHFLGDYKGKKVLIWFWSIKDPKAQEQISPLMLLGERNDNLKVLSFASESKVEVTEYVNNNGVNLSVIPNGDVFGQMAYGADLGKPRMFLIDESGVIHTVLPEEAFTDNSRLLVSLESIINGMN